MSIGPESGSRVCVICGQHYVEFGHNAEPVRRGRCCNICNDAHVIPTRIRLMHEALTQNEKPATETPDGN